MKNVDRIVILFFILLFVLTSCFSENNDVRIQQHDQINDQLESDIHRYIVLFRDEIEEKLIEDVEGVIIQEAETINVVGALLPDDEIDHLRKNPEVIAVEEDQVVSMLQQTQNWGYDQILTPRSVQSGLTGKGVKVAIIDSGVSPHEDLSIVGGASFVNYTNNYFDDNGHGTHVAGIVGALNNNIGIIGVAPNAEIYALKVLDQTGNGYLSDIIAAIDWSIRNRIDILNLSIGTNGHSAVLEKAVNDAYTQNILVVAAAGNGGNPEGTGDTLVFPARYQSAIAVAATDRNNKRGSFSATGNLIEQSAPGVNIYSTYLNNQYVSMNGTSMATPFVVGALALLKEANPRLNAKDLREILKNTSLDLGKQGRDEWFGYGLIQAPVFLTDIYGHWAIHDIVEVFHLGWMRGIKQGEFGPELQLSRAQAAAILVRALGLTKTSGNTPQFQDIKGHWAQEDIEIISQHQIMRGTAENRFSPDVTITREQMAAILSRILNLKRTPEMGNPFIDVQEGYWATNDVIATTHHQIFKGISPNQFGGGLIVTRAQMAVLMNRVSDQIAN
ncbi:hypothetical protein BKP37_11005 [Anaerobacillus alkalilacustris]|uniref:SLH domain-containing protein n=1 Tax=Anaerobacillus alkalilacustris TaxID=393763 RepID=A0A1S2LLF0_9BACI|nr:S8 family serine peptidase [Anaerobacillus alkalilacustris]OIJ13040.1 hypothetical protein BKP37_11005 [Anaerobacillus alkalilacustris]